MKTQLMGSFQNIRKNSITAATLLKLHHKSNAAITPRSPSTAYTETHFGILLPSLCVRPEVMLFTPLSIEPPL
jgi:hypothetical protein